jgi:hypothetical protein
MFVVKVGLNWQVLVSNVEEKLAWPAATFTSFEREADRFHEYQLVLRTCFPPSRRFPMAMSGRRI